MFFDDLKQIPELAKNAGTVVFGVPKDAKVEIPGAIMVEPKDDKNYISVDQVREVIEMSGARQETERFFVFKEAEKLREDAENAMLKLLEEPKDHYHFVLFSETPEALLPTILSRAEVYFLRRQNRLIDSPKANKKVLEVAKRLLVARRGNDYLGIADEIHKKKDERNYALEVLKVTIELAYKSYFATEKEQFLRKVPNYIKAHDNIQNNGNVRLHLVADLC